MKTVPVMGTLVTIQIVGRRSGESDREPEQAIERAFEWFHRVEACCSRFDPDSEAMQLTAHAGESVPVSEMLYEAVRFALAVADASGGAFDPTVGHRLEARGFNRNYRTGERVRTAIEPDRAISYHDVELDPDRTAIRLRRPLILDLGAVAKGLAIDMAAQELRAFENYAIDAGGDLYLGGRGPSGGPWSIGIRHPRLDNQLVDTIVASDAAVCTSGDYERIRAGDAGTSSHHIVDPRPGNPTTAVISATVVGPSAMLADALATAAFVLGPADGIGLLERQGVEGLILLPTLERHATKGWCGVCGPGDVAHAAAR
jgi:thiamine biosynthesis lipoprotein